MTKGRTLRHLASRSNRVRVYDVEFYGFARQYHRRAGLLGLPAGDARYLRDARLRRRLPGAPRSPIVVGRIGDKSDAKYTFPRHHPIMVCRPSSSPIADRKPSALAAPVILIALRLAQGWRWAGELAGAANLRGPSIRAGKTRLLRPLIQDHATLGMFLSLLVILFTRHGYR